MEKIGLSTSQAQELLKTHGLNELPAKKGISALRLLISEFNNMMSYLLLGAALLSFFVGDRIDAALIFFILFLNGSLGFWQEYKASKELEALRKLEVLDTRVIRDGKEIQIPANQLVPGDLIVLESGDKIPADAKLLEVHDLSVNESALTGESVPVVKSTDPSDYEIFFGTVVVSGRAKAQVFQTGVGTRFGKIALTLSEVKEEQTVMELSLNNLAKKVGLVAIGVAAAVFTIRIYQGWDFLEVFFTSIALMVAAVPEGLPAVITIVLALGVHRMYKRKTLVRKMGAIQDLGAATVICTDKTGTLTKNEMRVKDVFLPGNKDRSLLVKTAILCNSASLVLKENHGGFDILGDTTEGALLIWGKEKGVEPEVLRSEGKLIDELPFSLERRMMASVWEIEGKATLFVKGAPEVILSLTNLSDPEKEKLTLEYENLAAKGLRVLAFGVKELNNLSKFDIEKEIKGIKFLGFIGIADEARPEVKGALQRAKQAGIKVIMITGDNELTAKAIGEEVGLLDQGDEILTGGQIEQLTDQELLDKLDRIKIFARVIPEHKLRIVKLLQNKGEIVAVTGDGVNDALALKQSQVGIAMGITGTDVAKEASDLVVLDDNFATIVTAIEQGRLVYSNILKIVKFLLSGNFAELLVIGVAVVAGLPTPLLPVQILWVNFVSDGFPALALAGDGASSRIMHTPPHKNPGNILNGSILRFIFVAGVMMASVVLAIFVFTLNNFGLEVARSFAFSALVAAEMIFIFIMRRHHSPLSNKYLLASVIGVLAMQALIVTVPALKGLFKIG